MQVELSIIKHLLKHENFVQYSPHIKTKDFPDELGILYTCICSHFSVSEESLAIPDLANLVFSCNPKDSQFYKSLFDNLEVYQPIESTVVKLIESLKRRNVLQKVSLAAYEEAEGKQPEGYTEQLLSAITSVPDDYSLQPVTDDLESLLNATYKTPGLRWRLKCLNESIGSLRKGDFGFVFARPECISGDSIIRVKYNKHSSSSRKYTIATFYKLFNGNHHLKGIGQQIQASTPEGKVYYTDIEHVTYSGKKSVYQVKTRRGFSIKATAEHEFLLASGTYCKLAELYPGSEIRSDRTQKQARLKRPEIYGKWEGCPYPVKMLGGYGPYNRVKLHRACYDAGLNNLTLDDFVEKLKQGLSHTLVFSSSALDVHHINNNHEDNQWVNLTLVTRKEHTALHAKACQIGNQHYADVDYVESITYVGEEDTYDLGVSGENKNFKANGIFVHNCGKTTFLTSEVSHFITQTESDILWIVNEEQPEKVMLRVIQAFFGITLDILYGNIQHYRKLFKEQTGGRFKLYDSSASNKNSVEALCKKHLPALIVFDQIDKIQGFKADREDLLLGAIYQWARDLAKRYAPVIGVTQADGSGEGVRWLTMANVANAKTAKQAEADWILGIGAIPDSGWESVRFFNISKNKLLGDTDSNPELRHGKLTAIIEPNIARYRDV